jgi:hypothetical protein
MERRRGEAVNDEGRCQHEHLALALFPRQHKTQEILTVSKSLDQSSKASSYCFRTAWMIFPLLTTVRLDASIAQQSLYRENTVSKND